MGVFSGEGAHLIVGKKREACGTLVRFAGTEIQEKVWSSGGLAG